MIGGAGGGSLPPFCMLNWHPVQGAVGAILDHAGLNRLSMRLSSKMPHGTAFTPDG
jgi:hypothetical protein